MMELHDGLFATKFSELEQQFGRMLARIHVCQKMDLQQIHDELESMLNESAEHETLLKNRISASRLSAMEALSSAQLAYCQKADDILREQLIPELQATNLRISEGQAEATTLYAEYAIDLAAQATRYAMTAVFAAVEAQLKAEAKADESANHDLQRSESR